jgi:poly-gamma-glutamate capsule biosynthesis protein CapA/YwtB (metallophosphatase superfamily)
MRRTNLALFAVLVGSAAWAFSGSPTAQTANGQDARTGVISMALTGDSIITRPLSGEEAPAFQKMVALIRAQDVAFTNLEINLHDYEVYPMVESGGLHLRASPAIAKELVWAGFRLASFSNNHTVDWGVDGMRVTRRHAREAGLVLAGAGESLREARAAQFIETPKGRVGLVATASTFTTEGPAGDSLGDMPARPGLSALRVTSTHVLSPTAWSALRNVATELPAPLSASTTGYSSSSSAAANRMTLFGQSFALGERPGRQTTAHPGDLAQIAASVRNGRGVSDLLIVSIHAHESGAALDVPAQFLPTFAHAMIDAGADAVVGHGPHVLRGIEIYKGKPIFYSLGNFLFENETVERFPLEDYEKFGADPAKGTGGLSDVRYDNDRRGFPALREVYESVVAIPRWQNRMLTSIELHPISLGFGNPRTRRGRPMWASDELGRKIIEDVKRLSAPFGTRVEYRDGVGTVLLDAAAQQ